MAVINVAHREIQCKVVYYGPGRCGKTANLLYIYSKIPSGARGRMISIETDGEKTLFFDCLPLDLGEVRGFRIRLQLYTVPGQPHHSSTRTVVLTGADGVVFVADSIAVRREKNIASFRELERKLNDLGLTVDSIPVVLQYNKRDLQAGVIPILPLEFMERDLNPWGNLPCVAASAVTGYGVFDTLRSIAKRVAVSVSRKVLLEPKGPAVSAQGAGR
jgi:hypothetical protein